MTSAEDFRREMGEPDESFERCVLCTLTKLKQEEAKPVKKKISMGFALAAALVLLAVTALAAGSWGIVSYLREKGVEPAVHKLVTELPQQQGISNLAAVTIDELLIDGGKVYLAMTVQPKKEKTLMIPKVENLAVPGGMAALNNLDYDATMSVRAFAESKGFENIVGVTLEEGAFFEKLNNAVYQVLEDGTLRCLLEYNYAGGEAFPEERIWCTMNVLLLKYREDDVKPDHVRISKTEYVHLQLEVPLNSSRETRKSQAADAHGIDGYEKTIEYVTMTPMEDDTVQFTMLINTDVWKKNDFHFFTAALADASGKQLCRIDMGMSNLILSGKELWYGVVPVGYAQAALADKVTIQLQERVGLQWQARDTYTYTME